MTFGSRLRQLRLERGLTQRELAEPLFTAAYVSTIEADKRRPSPPAAQYFADKLGIDPEELVTGIRPGERVRLRVQLHDARTAIGMGEHAAATAMLDEIESVARRFDWTAEEADALVLRGLILEQTAAFDEAVQLFQRAQDLLREESPLREVDALVGRTRCLQMQGDVGYAIHLLETHLRVLREAGLEDPSAIARIHISLVATYFDAGLMKQAQLSAREALDLSPDVSDPDRMANMHINVARVLLEEGRHEEARRSFDRAEALYRGLDWKNDLGRVHLARAFGLLSESRPADAIAQLERAASIFEEAQSVLNKIRCALQLARAHRLMNDPTSAREVLQSIGMGKRVGPAEQGIAWRERGLCHVLEGNRSEAADCLRKALELFEEAQDTSESALTYRLLGDLMRDQDELVSACDAYRNAALALEHVA